MFRTVLVSRWLIAALASLALFIGCEDEPSTVVPVRDPEAANAKCDSANVILEEVLMLLINDADIQKPGDINLTRPYNAYLDALRLDDSHPVANFGAGILEVVMISQDRQLQSYFDRAKDFFERDSFFVVSGSDYSARSLGRPELRIDHVVLAVGAPLKFTRNFPKIAADADPTVNELQDVFRQVVLPRMETAVRRLQQVANHSDFRFMVTGRMQGDPREDPVELDLTEVYATIASLNVSMALLNNFCAYNFNFATYTGEALQAAFTRGSPFMALHSDGAQNMAKAGAQWLEAVNSVGNGIRFLETEIDPQGNDLIKIDPYDGITRSDLDSIKTYLPKIRNLLTGSQEFTIENAQGQDEIVEISLYAYFNDPIRDFKALLPPYTVSLMPEEDWEYVWGDSTYPATLQIESSGEYRWYRSAYYEDGEQWSYSDYSNFFVPEWAAAWNYWEARVIDSRRAYLSMSYWGYLEAGRRQIECQVYYEYDVVDKWRYAVRITWQANHFQEWVFPDPTFGGLFPQMTDSRFKRTFGITAEDWEKSILLRLWEN
ncbi:MAG: hypothetical protein FJY67_05245 [Calditrichaeota bacterium]|nr:hypothetical protein [Calditrichota bacterium]